jgi:plasmid stabilization system protein ParE
MALFLAGYIRDCQRTLMHYMGTIPRENSADAAENHGFYRLSSKNFGLVGGNLRELTIVYPYVIRYEVLGNDVTILRVRHGMRRP